MKRSVVRSALVAAALSLAAGSAMAEDLDLFVQPAGASGGPANVLIILDNTANWGRNVGGQAIWINERAAMVQTLQNLPVNADGSAAIRVGVMMFNETGNPNNNVGGGYVRAAVRGMTAAYKTKYNALLTSFDVNSDKSNNGKAGLVMAEAWRYFKGQAPYAGNSKVKTDYLGNVSGTAQSKAIYAMAGNAINSFAGSPYNSPATSGDCGRNYIVYVSNGAAQDNNSDIATGTAMLATAAAAESISGATTAIPISPSGSQANMSDEWARFMLRSSLGVVTYTVDVDKITTGQGPGWSALLRSMAGESSRYFDVTSGTGGAQIADALGRIFSEIQAVNSVFASVSLPVSVNTQGVYLNQIFVGMFRPDQDAMPRWDGNLKQYRLGIVGGLLRTLDADGNSAINSLTGFISECARSYWTPSSTDTYWTFKPQGGCLTVANSDISNYPDGNVVEKGGQGYLLRSGTTRTVDTCSPVFASCTALTTFSTGNAAITTGLLGAASAAERDTLIDWQKGQDLSDEDNDTVTAAEARASVHGDIIHSRPVAVNFGTSGSPQVVVFYGGNDGVLRAVNGNRSGAIAGIAAGRELWAFIAPEFFSSIKRLHDNNVPLSYKNAVSPPARLPKPYGFDGPVVAVQEGSSTWIYTAMHRGGRFIYSFDVSTINTDPATVSLKWKRGCPSLSSDVGCSTGFDNLGQTWSSPHLIKTNGYTSGASPAPMLIFGGGYDTCEDADPHTCTSSAKGRGIYVMDANTGSLLATLATDRPVVGDVFVVPEGSTGLARYAYAADTGGNIYRISGATANSTFGSTSPASWTITKIASLGCDTAAATSPSASCAMNRKFMYGPDVAYKDGVYYVLLGSGDREKPLMAYTTAYNVQNYFFMVKDSPQTTTWLSGETANCSASVICLDSLVTIASGGSDPDATELAAAKGWALALRAHEQSVTAGITVFGTTTFSTHTPTVPVAGVCTSNLGTARVYNVRYSNAATIAPANNRDEEIAGGGLPPSPVAGMVELDDGSLVPFVIGSDSDSPLESYLPSSPSSGTQPKSLTYWLNEK